MKIDEIARPGLIALGLAGIAAGAVLGFAAGMALSRDPQGLRRTAKRLARETAKGIERAGLLAAQAREHVADLWAEAREEALAEVDAADFAKAAARGATGGAAAAPAAAAPAAKRARRSAGPRARRSAEVPAADTKTPESR